MEQRSIFRVQTIQRHLCASEESVPNTTNVVIVGIARTPIGSFNGKLSSLSAPQLGAVAIKASLERAGVSPEQVQEVYFGNVLQANVGQAPAKQASLLAGIPNTVPCTTVHKVCASGMKAVMLGASSIQLGINEVVVAGGMESMSNAPYYLPNARQGLRMGDGKVIDGAIKDGLWDPYGNYHMGVIAEKCAAKHNISREQQHIPSLPDNFEDTTKMRIFFNQLITSL
eukprot:TRINITY_DN4182_c0_g2_i2.p1 TRINITY_DN4182_c0_g2~~TRINITY_DN4182_c0_g2_i2.p1  ORF type:complete len:227 (-),score=42.41 TRINITY_DN4182_c0_g2_i2:36-716(-)